MYKFAYTHTFKLLYLFASLISELSIYLWFVKASYPKRCSKCDSDNGPAAKRCRICKETITSVNETNEDDDTQQILNMGKTNPTKQFNMLKKRVSTA